VVMWWTVRNLKQERKVANELSGWRGAVLCFYFWNF
jgi:hypothetical protein